MLMGKTMADQFIAEIRIVGWNFAAFGWALCNGQTLSISGNTALFSLVGTFYGGNGTSNFLLPNLQGRIPMHAGQGSGLTTRTLGSYGGVESVTQQAVQIPQNPVSPVTAHIGNQPHLATESPFLVLNFIIALQGIFPSRG
jgi:microcystin-dependent protein